jgi:hypothetical protein
MRRGNIKEARLHRPTGQVVNVKAHSILARDVAGNLGAI